MMENSAAGIITGIYFIFTGIIYVGLSIPLLKRKIKMNDLYGIRINKSYESEENWDKLNENGAKELIKWGIVLIILGAISFFINIDENNLFFYFWLFIPVIVLIPPLINIFTYAKKL